MNKLNNKRNAYLKAAVNFFEIASKHAEAGDIHSAAVLIIKALDQERRASSVGPQVLQLIKPPSF